MTEDLLTLYPFANPLGSALFVVGVSGRFFVEAVLDKRMSKTDEGKASIVCYRHAADGLSLLSAGFTVPFMTSSAFLLVPIFLITLATAYLHVRQGMRIARNVLPSLVSDAPKAATSTVNPVDGAMASLFTVAGPAGLLAWLFFQLS